MKATETSLSSFLSQNKTQFIIPVYQRNYDWLEEQCKQLFSDIIEVGTSDEASTHFIGSIVFIHDGVYTSSDVKPLVVIDGQQRLTTISLLYLAMYNAALEFGNTEKATEINETYLINKFVKEDSSKLKLKQTDINAKAFKFLLENSDPKEYGEFSKVIDNYSFFKRNITNENFETIVLGLSRLLFVEISLERGKDDPQRIFESLNSTGLELSQSDLIRNYILMGLDPKTQEKVFNQYWSPIEENAKDLTSNDSRVSDFIRDYLTLTNKKIPNKNRVYEEFKLKYPNRDDEFYNSTLTLLKKYSRNYRKLINPTEEPDKNIHRELRHINNLEINVCYPFLIPVFEDYNDNIISKEILLQVLRLIQTFAFRRFIVGLPTNALNRIFMTLYSDIDKSNYVQSIQTSLVKKRGAHRFPTDLEVGNVLKERDMYFIKSKTRSYYFELMENYNNKEYVDVTSSDITIEHIFPQNPDIKWNDDLDEGEMRIFKEKYLNTVSNLTLSGNNGALGNKTFIEKKNMNAGGGEQGYKYSRLWLNSFLKDLDCWGMMEYNRRFDIILERFLKIWSYPDVETLLKSEEDEENIFSAASPTGKKLDYFIFKGEQYVENEVTKMYAIVLQLLFHENPHTFFNTDLREYLKLTTNSETLNHAFALDENYSIESMIDNEGKFRRLKRALTLYNYEDELFIKYS
jgi:uncharacterized protein with ParB-like and HNH nuclease domain